MPLSKTRPADSRGVTGTPILSTCNEYPMDEYCQANCISKNRRSGASVTLPAIGSCGNLRKSADSSVALRTCAQKFVRIRRNLHAERDFGRMNNCEYYSFRAHPYSCVPIEHDRPPKVVLPGRDKGCPVSDRQPTTHLNAQTTNLRDVVASAIKRRPRNFGNPRNRCQSPDRGFQPKKGTQLFSFGCQTTSCVPFRIRAQVTDNSESSRRGARCARPDARRKATSKSGSAPTIVCSPKEGMSR